MRSIDSLMNLRRASTDCSYGFGSGAAVGAGARGAGCGSSSLVDTDFAPPALGGGLKAPNGLTRAATTRAPTAAPLEGSALPSAAPLAGNALSVKASSSSSSTESSFS